MDGPTQYALAYALTSTAGLRVFVTLAALSLALHWQLVPAPPHQFAWLASDGALIVLIAAAIVDVLGDKIPFVDHALQAVHTVSKPLAGAIVAGTIVQPDNDPSLIVLAVLGGANALAVHGISATARAASTATTGGLANPLVSVIEDLIAIGAIVAAWFMPLLTAAVILVLTIVGILMLRKLLRFIAAHREHRASPARSS